jgi:sensor histidine kinase YesM
MKLLRRILLFDLTIGIVGGLLMVTPYASGPSHFFARFGRSLGIVCFVATPVVVLLSLAGRTLYRRRFPWNWLLIVAGILVCTIVGNLGYGAAAVSLRSLAPARFWGSFWTRLQVSGLMALAFGVGGFGYGILRRDLEAATLQLRNAQLDRERAAKLALEAQLASLESHIRPHFLFNALNTISALIPEDPRLAEALVGKLAALLRLTLDSNPGRTATLERELKIATDYLEIERARFGDRLRCRLDVPPDLLSVEMPALALQTLVENSVKFAVSWRMEGAEIRVAARADGEAVVVEVSDDGPGFSAVDLRADHGLDNLQRRLRALFGPAASMEIAGCGPFTTVSLRLPRAAGKAV